MILHTLQAQINSCQRCIEIGGPTPHGYGFMKALGLHLPARIVVTNIANPIVIDPFGEHPETYPVDEIVDVTDLPYLPGSVDMLLACSLPRNLRAVLLQGATKVLRQGGLLLLENILPEDKACAQQLGFMPLLDTASEMKYYSQIYQWNGK